MAGVQGQGIAASISAAKLVETTHLAGEYLYRLQYGPASLRVTLDDKSGVIRSLDFRNDSAAYGLRRNVKYDEYVAHGGRAIPTRINVEEDHRWGQKSKTYRQEWRFSRIEWNPQISWISEDGSAIVLPEEAQFKGVKPALYDDRLEWVPLTAGVYNRPSSGWNFPVAMVGLVGMLTATVLGARRYLRP